MRVSNPDIHGFADIQQNFEDIETFLGFPAGVNSASGNVVLTTSVQAIAGTSLTVHAPGTFLVIGTFTFQASVTGWGSASGWLLHNGTGVPAATSALLKDSGAATQGASVSQSWIVSSCLVGDTLQLGASKGVNAGTIQSNQTTTTMMYLRIS